MSIYRATTPTLTFTFPFSVSTIDELNLSFAQNRRVLFVLGINDVQIDADNDAVVVSLTQEQTTKFVPDVEVEIQFRVKVEGAVMASNIIQTDTKRVLETEAL